jgi:hypothetical protein
MQPGSRIIELVRNMEIKWRKRETNHDEKQHVYILHKVLFSCMVHGFIMKGNKIWQLIAWPGAPVLLFQCTIVSMMEVQQENETSCNWTLDLGCSSELMILVRLTGIGSLDPLVVLLCLVISVFQFLFVVLPT